MKLPVIAVKPPAPVRPTLPRAIIARPALSPPVARSIVQRLTLCVEDIEHKDPHEAGKKYRYSNPQETLDNAITHCLKTLGQGWVQLGEREYAFKMRLPGAMLGPCPALLAWIKLSWGNYSWLADFTFSLLQGSPKHPMKEASIYFHSVPSALSKTPYLPDFNTCPIQFTG